LTGVKARTARRATMAARTRHETAHGAEGGAVRMSDGRRLRATFSTAAAGRAGAALLALLAGGGAGASSGPQRPVPLVELREERPAARARVIVELDGTPSARDRGTPSAGGRRALLARFRSDLERVAAASATAAPAPAPPVVRHEYRVALVGAALELDPRAIERVRRLPGVRAVHPDREVRAAAAAPDAPAPEAIDARPGVNAAGLGTSGAGIVVAVIDTGVDYTHPALGGGFGPGFKVAGGWDFVNGDADPMDDQGHGTHVAGTIAASAPDILGVAPDATLVAYKVLSAEGSGSTSDIIAAIERGLDPDGDDDPSDRVDVMNLSLGGGGDAEDPGSRAVDNAVAAGVVMVVAAGNDGRTMSIGSPGTAVGALTVAAIDGAGSVTSFSSRGPSPRLLGFKPDVAAPGAGIYSTRMGGGVHALSGTSMATPHVAGVAALLRALHPDWDAAAVKAAIAGGAVRTADPTLARGVGRVDALAAHLAAVVADRTGVSFGLRAAQTGTSSETQSVRLTNRSAGVQSLTLASDESVADVSVEVAPAALLLQPGETREVEITLHTVNDALAFPADALVGGDVVVGGTSSLSIPWGLLRTARATVTYDGIATSIVAVDAEGARGETLSSPDRSEILLPPGRQWDFIVTGYDTPAVAGAPVDVRRIAVKEGVTVDGDEVVAVRAADAAHEIVLDARDRHGTPLSERPGEEVVHRLGVRLYRQEGASWFSLLMLGDRRSTRRLFVSPLSDRYTLYAFEQYLDGESYEGYVVEYDALAGVSGGATLSPGGTDLARLGIRWDASLAAQAALDVCFVDATKAGSFASSFSTCTPTSTRNRTAFELYINDERSPLAHNGLQLRLGGVTTQALRGIAGEIVAASEITVPPIAARFPAGGEYALPSGPAYPFALAGTRTSPWFRLPPSGFLGAAGEQIAEAAGTAWTAYDADGSQTGAGIWLGPSVPSAAVPAPAPGARLVAIRDDLPAVGRAGRGTLDVRFGQDATDVTAPSLTSLRVAGGGGHPAIRLARGEAASLRFSVADLDFARAAQTGPTDPASTHASFRPHGTSGWQPLALAVTGSEAGSLATLRHVPAGDMYVADLGAATSGPATGWFDLRLEFRDAAGNRVEWTLESAFVVGTPPRSPRGRLAR